MTGARVAAVCLSPEKGRKKVPVDRAVLKAGHGLEGDGHAGAWHRQISLLAQESVDKMRVKGLDVGPGSFAENLLTEGLDLVGLPIGSRLRVGKAVLLEITQIGKECHDRCAIYHQVGDCVMPREGVFAKVLEGGEVKAGDEIVVEG